MGYKSSLNLNPEQLELIECALREQLSRLNTYTSTDADDEENSLDDIREIQELLGHLHDQKIWYRPSENIPQG